MRSMDRRTLGLAGWPAFHALVLALVLLACVPGGRAWGQAGNAFGDRAAAAEQGPTVDIQESILSWAARASGPIGVVIALMSFYLIALVVWMALNYRAVLAIPETLLDELSSLLDQARYGDAYSRLMADRSPLARVLAAAVKKLPAGLATARRALELAVEDLVMEMEHRTTYLATVGTLGPMIGLVGTVYGMIMSFRVIATAGAAPQAAQIAAGISTALFATLEGILISIPAIYFHAYFRNRIARLALEVETAAESLLERFAPGIKPQAHPAAAAPAAPPHPFAVSAALAAAQTPQRSALPPIEPKEG